MSALLDLAARAEAASVKDQANLLEDAWDGLGSLARWTAEQARRFGNCMDAGAHESAAVMLVPPDSFWRVGHDGEGPDPSLFASIIGVAREGDVWMEFRRGTAEAAPLALVASSLRAWAAL